jgi:hypothetical protein
MKTRTCTQLIPGTATFGFPQSFDKLGVAIALSALATLTKIAQEDQPGRAARLGFMGGPFPSNPPTSRTGQEAKEAGHTLRDLRHNYWGL